VVIGEEEEQELGFRERPVLPIDRKKRKRIGEKRGEQKRSLIA